MIKSMTGYGSAQGQLDDTTYVVEIRTLNSRYLKTRIKLPDSLAFLEEDVERFLHTKLSRGTVNYVLRLENVPANALFNIDEQALQTYTEQLARIASSANINCPIDIGGLLNLPGIVHPISPDEKKASKIRDKVLKITQAATDKLNQMRTAEGKALAADMKGHCKAIKENLAKIRDRSDTVITEHRDKLKKKIDKLLENASLELDEATLAREVAVFAEKSDVCEEIARLESHLRQFTNSCRTDGQAGRRLDFLSQEMLREANTIASKAGDTEIIHVVVDIKCSIDRIKEQVQNIE